MNTLHLFSILLELLITLMGVKLILQKKIYGWGITLTFAIYVFYDLAKFFMLNLSANFLYFIFFIASTSAFAAVWQLTQKK